MWYKIVQNRTKSYKIVQNLTKSQKIQISVNVESTSIPDGSPKARTVATGRGWRVSENILTENGPTTAEQLSLTKQQSSLLPVVSETRKM